jgi:hypothetical protein
VRYVDSSVGGCRSRPRAQPGRHAVLCNGRFVPMKATDNREVAVAASASGMAAGLGPAPGTAGQHAAHLRHLRPLVGPLGRRLRLPCRPSAGVATHLSGQRQRGRGAAARRFGRAATPHAFYPGERRTLRKFPLTLDLRSPQAPLWADGYRRTQTDERRSAAFRAGTDYRRSTASPTRWSTPAALAPGMSR